MKAAYFLILFIGLATGPPCAGAEKNGFDLSDSLIPAEKILSGGPPRDGIPSIDRPQFVSADQANFVAEKDRVIGVLHQGIAKAYPVKILDWHEIVNDETRDLRILVSYCPLCGTGIVFDANEVRDFGVSGLLYNSDVLMYDRQSGSLWSQIMGKAISGPRRGDELAMLPASHTTWRDWRSRYPDTLVLSTDTGFKRDYGRSPYLDYAQSPRLMFDVEYRNQAFKNKELVMGVVNNGVVRAYPFKALKRRATPRFEDLLGDESVTIVWSDSEKTASILRSDGQEIPTVIAYWFAWYTFHPDTEVYEAVP